MSAVAQKKSTQKLILQMLTGALVGGAATGLFIVFVGKPFADLDNPATLVAIAAGICYLIIGLSVAFGIAAPKAGAAFLNVEDASELREDGRKLTSSAVACVLTGVFLLILAFADTLGRGLALPLALASLAGVAIAGWLGARHQDELTKQVGLEASALAFQITVVLIGGWAALAALGYAIWISPLALVSGLTLLQLFAIFVIAGKRGMLTPR